MLKTNWTHSPVTPRAPPPLTSLWVHKSHLTTNLYWECCPHYWQSCCLQEEELPLWDLRNSLPPIRQIIFSNMRAEFGSHCLSFPVLSFVINQDFCFVLFSSLQRKSNAAGLFAVGWIWCGRKFKWWLLGWSKQKHHPRLLKKWKLLCKSKRCKKLPLRNSEFNSYHLL